MGKGTPTNPHSPHRGKAEGICQTNSGRGGGKAPTRASGRLIGQVSSFSRKTRCPVSLDCENQTQGPKRLQQESRRVHLRRRGRKADICSALLVLAYWLPEQSNGLWIGCQKRERGNLRNVKPNSKLYSLISFLIKKFKIEKTTKYKSFSDAFHYHRTRHL